MGTLYIGVRYNNDKTHTVKQQSDNNNHEHCLLNTLLLLQHHLRWHDANVHDDVYACETAKVSQWS